MVNSLSRNFGFFESWIKTMTGIRFRGVIQPETSNNVAPNQTVENRLVLHTRRNEPVQEGMLIIDPAGRPFLIGRDDIQLSDNIQYGKTFRLFRMTGQYSWKRMVTTVDPVTQLPRRSSEQELGPIWAAIEKLSNLDFDRGTHMVAEQHQVITGAAVALGDKIDGLMVRRVTITFGISICETE